MVKNNIRDSGEGIPSGNEHQEIKLERNRHS